jgi:hypothetical protein
MTKARFLKYKSNSIQNESFNCLHGFLQTIERASRQFEVMYQVSIRGWQGKLSVNKPVYMINVEFASAELQPFQRIVEKKFA